MIELLVCLGAVWAAVGLQLLSARFTTGQPTPEDLAAMWEVDELAPAARAIAPYPRPEVVVWRPAAEPPAREPPPLPAPAASQIRDVALPPFRPPGWGERVDGLMRAARLEQQRRFDACPSCFGLNPCRCQLYPVRTAERRR